MNEFFIVICSAAIYAAAFAHGRYVESRKKNKTSVSQTFCYGGSGRMSEDQMKVIFDDISQEAMKKTGWHDG